MQSPPFVAGVDAIEARTTLYVAPDVIYEFIQGYEGVSDYSAHLDRVEQDGDGGPGTEYRITFSWWRLSWTSRTRVTEVDPPNRIAWRSVDAVRARGWWGMEPTPEADLPEGRDVGTKLTLRIEFDPATMRGGSITRLVPLGRLVERVTPVVRDQCEEVLARVAEDLEGERRSVEYTVVRAPTSF
jgi:uncharacterized membrane protein